MGSVYIEKLRKNDVLSVVAKNGDMIPKVLSVLKDGKQVKLNDEFTFDGKKYLVIDIDPYRYDDPKITLTEIAEKIEETKPANSWWEKPMSALI